MRVRRHLAGIQRVHDLTANFSQSMTVAYVEWHASLKIWQSKSLSSITAEGCSQQREERLVLVDGQKLSIAKRPAFGCNADREYSDFRDIRC